MNEYLIEALTGVMQTLKTRLDEHETEVIVTLRRVAKGELKMSETISPEEEQLARTIFEWVAATGPRKVLAKIEPLLTDPGTLKGEIALDKIFVDPGFAVNLPPLGDRIDKRTLTRLAVLLMSYIFYEQFHYPQPETGVYDIAGSTFEKIKWVYRYWFNQLEVAEKGSRLEEFFAAQDLNVLNRPPADLEDKFPDLDIISVSCAGDLLAVDVLTPENTPTCSTISPASTVLRTSLAPIWSQPSIRTVLWGALKRPGSPLE